MAGYDGNGTFTKSIDWIDDQTNGIPIRADRHDTVDNEFVSGFNLALTRDGQAIATADLPMGTFKHTNVGNAVDRTNYLSMAQFQDQGGIYFASTGSSNAYVLTPSPAITAYAAGQRFVFKANFANTGAATLNISALGVKSLKKNIDDDLAANDIIVNQIVYAIYDGTNFQIISPIANEDILTQAILSSKVFLRGE